MSGPADGEFEHGAIAPSSEAVRAAMAEASMPGAIAVTYAAGRTAGDAGRLVRLSWALFDCARTPFVLLVTVFLFAPYFASKVVAHDPVRGQAIWLAVQGYSGLVIAVLAPFVGAISDAGGRRKPWIVLFGAVMAVAAALLWFAKPAGTGLSVGAVGTLAGIACIALEFVSVFYNAMLPSIASPRQLGSLSGLGLALGNAASLLLLLLILYAFVLPGRLHGALIPSRPWFGIDQATHEPERLSGPLCAAALLVFNVPLLLFVPDPHGAGPGWATATREGIASVFRTLRSLKHYRNVATYIAARLFFNDGMTALLSVGGIYAAGVFGWGALGMTVYAITLSIFAVLGGLAGGWLDDRFGSKAALLMSVSGTLVLGGLSVSMGPERVFWVVRINSGAAPHHAALLFHSWPEALYLMLVSLVAACVTASYASARTMMVRISPPQRMTEFFGLYSLSGQSTTFLATLSASWLTTLTQSQRGGMIAVMIFLALGLIGLAFVKEEPTAAA